MFRRKKGDQNKSTIVTRDEKEVLPRSQWREFIDAAYRGVLGRPVDDEALAFCLDRLERGWTAMELLSELAKSGESRRLRHEYSGFSAEDSHAGLSADFAQFSEALARERAVDMSRFERVWQDLPNYPAYNVIGQAQYCEQHKQRFFELTNAVAFLTRDKHCPRVLEIGVSACSNLYAQLFPEVCLELMDRPTAPDYPGFTQERCEAIQGCSAYYSLDLTEPQALAEGTMPGLADYDLILMTEVLPLLCVHPQQLLSRLIQRLAPGGLYLHHGAELPVSILP